MYLLSRGRGLALTLCLDSAYFSLPSSSFLAGPSLSWQWIKISPADHLVQIRRKHFSCLNYKQPISGDRACNHKLGRLLKQRELATNLSSRAAAVHENPCERDAVFARAALLPIPLLLPGRRRRSLPFCSPSDERKALRGRKVKYRERKSGRSRKR